MKKLSPEEMLDKEIHDAKFLLWRLLKGKGNNKLTNAEVELFAQLHTDLFLSEVLD